MQSTPRVGPSDPGPRPRPSTEPPLAERARRSSCGARPSRFAERVSRVLHRVGVVGWRRAGHWVVEVSERENSKRGAAVAPDVATECDLDAPPRIDVTQAERGRVRRRAAVVPPAGPERVALGHEELPTAHEASPAAAPGCEIKKAVGLDRERLRRRANARGRRRRAQSRRGVRWSLPYHCPPQTAY